ncbi:hypothetical protein BJY52DRAFT_606605 [Lactarius psammicola]|nr:hypothetical protein BJY52DRAFT_606605 [Lactarius psammicola]
MENACSRHVSRFLRRLQRVVLTGIGTAITCRHVVTIDALPNNMLLDIVERIFFMGFRLSLYGDRTNWYTRLLTMATYHICITTPSQSRTSLHTRNTCQEETGSLAEPILSSSNVLSVLTTTATALLQMTKTSAPCRECCYGLAIGKRCARAIYGVNTSLAFAEQNDGDINACPSWWILEGIYPIFTGDLFIQLSLSGPFSLSRCPRPVTFHRRHWLPV